MRPPRRDRPRPQSAPARRDAAAAAPWHPRSPLRPSPASAVARVGGQRSHPRSSWESAPLDNLDAGLDVHAAPPDPVLDQTVAESSSRSGELTHLRSEEHTSELQSLMRISYAVFCLKKIKQH